MGVVARVCLGLGIACIAAAGYLAADGIQLLLRGTVVDGRVTSVNAGGRPGKSAATIACEADGEAKTVTRYGSDSGASART